jgi:hypothetical protein
MRKMAIMGSGNNGDNGVATILNKTLYNITHHQHVKTITDYSIHIIFDSGTEPDKIRQALSLASTKSFKRNACPGIRSK